MASLIDRHRDQILGVLSCFDRVVIRGTLPSVCHAQAMATTLDSRGIRLFDYATEFAQPFRESIRAHADSVAAEGGIEVEYIKKPKGYRKEDRIREIVAKRGSHPGLVHVFSVMELCSSYRPWHDKRTGLTHLRPDGGKCVYYYFYFIDEVLGLCFLSVPTWCPFRAQFYFNGHNWLASKLKSGRHLLRVAGQRHRRHQPVGAGSGSIRQPAGKRASHANGCCRCALRSGPRAARSLSLEHRPGRVRDRHHLPQRFRSHSALRPSAANRHSRDQSGRYRHVPRPLARHTAHTRDRRRLLDPHPRHTRGHYLGPASIKMYDKHGFILRVETTTNDVSFFRHHRMVEQRDGQRVMKLAQLKKSIYSLFPDLASISRAANDRYIQFLSTIDDPTPGLKALSKISDSVEEREHRYRGFNLFDDDDQSLFEILCRGEFFIQGFRNRSLREHLGRFRSSQVSRLLKRLRLHGIIKKVGKTYKYYLTELGRHVAVAGLTLKDLFLVPEFASAALAH